ncbi:DUF2612 domain-containing protein [Bilophila wadsworthia]|uniref:DUF2612 domain-containing protein n=1 Tax=Bilophila wadsworthia TaxID=35833 RepID=UPI00399C4F57
MAEHINGLNIGDDVAFAPVLARERGQRRLLRHRVHHARDVAGRAVRRKRGRRLQRRGVLLGGSRQAGGAAMSGYLGLVTSEHRNRPRFMATVAAVTDPLCGLQELLETMRAAFDVDSAVGGQLDRTGEWIGRSRHLRLELDDVYFEWGREAVGWARGSWKGLYDPETGMVRLPDETYRLLLKAKIGANRWDGSARRVESECLRTRASSSAGQSGYVRGHRACRDAARRGDAQPPPARVPAAQAGRRAGGVVRRGPGARTAARLELRNGRPVRMGQGDLARQAGAAAVGAGSSGRR